MKKTLLSIVTILSSGAFFSQCSDIFISEYVEGWSNNKAIEIYNPTANPIDLSAYELRRYSNGSTSATSAQKLPLAGIINPYDVRVFVLDKRDPNGTGQEAPVWDSLQVKADTFVSPVYNVNETMYFNGNDAMVIFKGTSVIDVVGKVGEDPGTGKSSSDEDYGWPIGGPIAWTKDHTLVRKYTVQQGSTNATANFDPAIQWDSLPANTFTSLGFHDCGCNPASIKENAKVEFSMYPNPSANNTVTINSFVDIKNITVFNLVGEQVYSSVINNLTTAKLNTANWNKGLYLVTIDFGKGNKSTKKLIIN